MATGGTETPRRNSHETNGRRSDGWKEVNGSRDGIPITDGQWMRFQWSTSIAGGTIGVQMDWNGIVINKFMTLDF